MSKLSLMRNPIARKKNGTKINCIPDLAREISEQDLTAVSGGITPSIAATIMATVMGATYVTNLITAMNSRRPDSGSWHP